MYGLLSRLKGNRSFSEVIKEAFVSKSSGKDIMRFAGALKGDKNLTLIKKLIERDRERNYGREFE